MYKILEWFKGLFKKKEEPKDIDKAVLDLEDRVKSFIYEKEFTYHVVLGVSGLYDYKFYYANVVRDENKKLYYLAICFYEQCNFNDRLIIRITLDDDMKYVDSAVEFSPKITDVNGTGTAGWKLSAAHVLREDIVKNCIEKE